MSTLLKQIPRVNTLIRRFPVLYKAAREQIAQFEDMDLEQRAEHQEARVRTMLKAAGYGSAKLQDLALVDKTQVRADPARFERWAPLPVVRTETSGTSGVPLRIRGSGDWFSQGAKTFEAILAPLADDGARVNMIFGAFVFDWDMARRAPYESPLASALKA